MPSLHLLLLQKIQLCFEHLHRFILVLMLRTLVLALYDNPRRDMRDTDRGRRLVDVLSACPARTVRIDTQIVHIDLDIDILLDIRHDITAHERCLTLARRIERGNPNKTVYTLF